MPRTPPRAPEIHANGQHPDVKVVVRGEAARKLEHLAQQLDTSPDEIVAVWLSSWPPVPNNSRGG